MSFPWPSAEVFIFVIDQARNMTFYCVRFLGKNSLMGCSSHWATIYRTILEKTRNFTVIILSLAGYKLWRSIVRYFSFSALCVTELIYIQSLFDFVLTTRILIIQRNEELRQILQGLPRFWNTFSVLEWGILWMKFKSHSLNQDLLTFAVNTVS